MAATDTIPVIWNEDGSASCLGRATAHDATGAATGITGEGKFIKQADLSTIICEVFDMTNVRTSVATPTVTISSVILDTPVTDEVIWTRGSTGYNFHHDLAETNFPIGGHVYLVEYYFATTGGTKWPVRYQGEAKARVAG